MGSSSLIITLGFEPKKGFLGLGMKKWGVRCDIAMNYDWLDLKMLLNYFVVTNFFD
jgi:hypothetical protein